MFNLDDDAPARRLAYLSAFLLVFIPILQTATQIWPLQLGNIQWRFQAAGVLSTVLIFPFLGMALMAMIARATEARGASKAIGILSAIVAVILAISLVLFALDALQLKAIVASRAMQQFQLAIVRVGLVTTTFLVLFAILAMTALRPPRGTAPAPVRGVKRKGNVSDDSPTLVVGQEFAKAE
jgi:hypothetical protein